MKEINLKSALTAAALILAAFAIALLTGCSSKNSLEYIDQTIFGMDTYTTIRLSSNDDKINDEYAGEIKKECAAIIAKNEKILSARDEDGLIYKFNHSADAIENADKVLIDVLKSAVKISEQTGGAYEPTIGALSELWNVNGGGPVPSDADIKSSLEHVGRENITIEETKVSRSDVNCYVDLGGVGKGYTVQNLLEYLSRSDVPFGLVSMGGNIGVFGTKPNSEKFKIGICDPDDASGVVGYLSISSGFISVSGDYERYFEENGERYHHIIDPATGYPAKSDVRSVAVYANNGAAADALSTALFVMGEEKALEFYGENKIAFEAIIINKNHEIILTDGVSPDDFELAGENYVLKTQAER